MSNDPDLEQKLERLMSRVDLPKPERWVPSAPARSRTPWKVVTVGSIATALLLVTVIGVVGSDVAAPNASRRPLQTLPTLLRPTPTESTAPPPRGTAVTGPAGTILDFTEDAGSMAADDHALAAVVGDAASSRIVVTEIGRQRHVVEVTRGRVAFISPHGALRGDLVAYTESESKDVSAAAPVVVWHVMVANWRTGSMMDQGQERPVRFFWLLSGEPGRRIPAPWCSGSLQPAAVSAGRRPVLVTGDSLPC